MKETFLSTAWPHVLTSLYLPIYMR